MARRVLDRRRVPKAFRRDIEIRSRPLEARLNNFLKKLARREVRRAKEAGMLSEQAIREVAQGRLPITKAVPQDLLELAEAFRVFGLRRLNSAGKKTAGSTGTKWIARPEVIDQFLASKEIKVREFLEETNKAFAEDIRRVLLEAAAEDPQPTTTEIGRRLFQKVTSEGPMSPGRAQRIARTETAQSENAGIHEGYTAAGIKRMEWVTTKDLRTRSSHRRLDGKRTDIGVPFTFRGEKGGTVSLRFPGDPSGPPEEIIHCFPAECIVQGQASAAMRFKYVGPMIRILTRSGRKVTVTPNHPVLTDAGFRPISSIKLGDDVLSYSSRYKGQSDSGIVDDEQNTPSSIKEVFDALRSRGGRSRQVTVDDFDGDGNFGQADVYIVGADGPLLVNDDTVSLKPFSQFILELADMAFPRPSEKRSAPLGLGVLPLPPSTGPCPGTLPLNRGPVEFEPRPLQPLRFGPASELDASRYESGAETSPIDAGFLSQLIERGAGLISRDKVVEVRDFTFSGHVYDLQSPVGWLIADGIVSSNCRCVTIPVIEKRKRKA